MIGSTETTRSPEEIESEIARTRASLEAKIHEIERRLSPREQMARVRAQLNPEPYVGWMAAAAVALGMLLAWRAWQKARHPRRLTRLDDPAPAEIMGE